MKLTIEIHDAWLGRPEDLRKILTTLAGLECPPTGSGTGPRPASPPGYDPREELEKPFDPEGRPRGRSGNGRYPGDDDRNQASYDEDQEEGPPTDGRQLLGWAAKQVPDAKGLVISLGKRNTRPSGPSPAPPRDAAAGPPLGTRGVATVTTGADGPQAASESPESVTALPASSRSIPSSPA
jgi:hypothetical protein